MKWILPCVMFCAFALHAQTGLTVIKASRLFDGKRDTVVQPGIVVVRGNKIESIGGFAPPGAAVVDLGDATLLPGFIDSHTHLTMAFNPDYNGGRLAELSRTIPEQAIR